MTVQQFGTCLKSVKSQKKDVLKSSNTQIKKIRKLKALDRIKKAFIADYKLCL